MAPILWSLVLTLHKISKEISSVFSLNLSLSLFPELFMTKYCGQKKSLHGKSIVHSPLQTQLEKESPSQTHKKKWEAPSLHDMTSP